MESPWGKTFPSRYGFFVKLPIKRVLARHNFRICRNPTEMQAEAGGGGQGPRCLRFRDGQKAQTAKKNERFVYRSVLLFWRGTSCRLLALRDVDFRSC
jgi:hypothetical protein